MNLYEPSEYQPKIMCIFESIKQQASRILPGARIEHIGSSSINGAISKGDLDIFVGIQVTEFEISIKLLDRLGFHVKKDTLRTESLCMLESMDYQVDVAIQLVARGSEFENFLLFRDRLNAEPQLVEQYNELKRKYRGLDEKEYRKKKSLFIAGILGSQKTLEK